jgi:hypothetical protein
MTREMVYNEPHCLWCGLPKGNGLPGPVCKCLERRQRPAASIDRRDMLLPTADIDWAANSRKRQPQRVDRSATRVDAGLLVAPEM